ncbi:MAG: hypothetical protein HWN67_15245 [Candidatus Helarchaeota archaeon]|nr:hypothetical protein [Candidatus Helarchaeota archaeon]
MKFKLAAVSFIILCFFINCFTSSSQNFIYNIKYKQTPHDLSALDAESDAISNITLAEDLIFSNFEILLGTELNEGDVWYLYLGLANAMTYLNKAESDFFKTNYSIAISKAKKAQSIAQGILPLSLLKGFESVSNKEFMNLIMPIYITIIIVSIIIGIILIYHARKSYQRRKDEKEILKKKIIITNKETKVNK